jgi:hypothetical protein
MNRWVTGNSRPPKKQVQASGDKYSLYFPGAPVEVKFTAHERRVRTEIRSCKDNSILLPRDDLVQNITLTMGPLNRLVLTSGFAVQQWRCGTSQGDWQWGTYEKAWTARATRDSDGYKLDRESSTEYRNGHIYQDSSVLHNGAVEYHWFSRFTIQTVNGQPYGIPEIDLPPGYLPEVDVTPAEPEIAPRPERKPEFKPVPVPVPVPVPGQKPITTPGPVVVPKPVPIPPSPETIPDPTPNPRPIPNPGEGVEVKPEQKPEEVPEWKEDFQGKPIGQPAQRPAATAEGTAEFLGKIEQKLVIVGDMIKTIPPTNVNPPDWLDELLAWLMSAYDGGSYQLQGPCERQPDGTLKPPVKVEWQGGVGATSEVSKKIDALAALIQAHKDMGQPVCIKERKGQPVTVILREKY